MSCAWTSTSKRMLPEFVTTGSRRESAYLRSSATIFVVVAGSVAHGKIVLEPGKGAPHPDAVGKHGPQPGNLGRHSHVRCDIADAPSGAQ